MNKVSSIWFLPAENTWGKMNFMAMKDSGVLKFNDNELLFEGKKNKVSIKNIQSVSYGKQGRDFVNNWVKVEYKEGQEVKNAFFADGKMLGWSGIFGGTKSLMKKIEEKYK